MIVKIIEKTKVVETIEFGDYVSEIIAGSVDEIEINNKLFIIKKRRFLFSKAKDRYSRNVIELHLFV